MVSLVFAIPIARTNTHPDSTMGKLMQKAGGMMNNEKLEAKGQAKRAEAGANVDGGNYGSTGGNTDSYGSSGNNNNQY